MSEQTSPQSGGGTRSAREILSVLLAAEAVYGPFIPEEHDDEPEPLTAERLAEIRARVEAATPGPWWLTEFAEVRSPQDETVADIWEPTRGSRNGEFIAHSRTDVLALLDEVERARAAEDEAQRRYITDTADLKRRHAEAAATVARLEQRRVEVEKQHNADRAEREELRQRVAELEARLRDLERPAVEAERQRIRDSYGVLIMQAEQDRDSEGAFEMQCRLRDREEQWKREDEEGKA